VIQHLDACVLPRPSSGGCEEVREQYGGLCPDHDGLCAPGCPVAELEQQRAAIKAEEAKLRELYDELEEVKPNETP
jgi:hypothetical protein